MESFKSIRWNVDVHRKESPGAGKGIFCLRPVVKSTCVALYFGHLVDSKGVIVVSCPFTESLFNRLPSVKRPYSRGHGVYVNSVACPHILIVDGTFVYAALILRYINSDAGSHHACSAFDKHDDRCGVPWGSCLNSSDSPGVKANCQLVW